MNVTVCTNANCFQVYETEANEKSCGACGSNSIRVYLDTTKDGVLNEFRAEVFLLTRVLEANQGRDKLPMFHICMRKTENGFSTKWFYIWSSNNGADAATYLRQLTQEERPGVLYAMTYGRKVGEPLRT